MKRDLRLDFLRGVVLLLIVMDHARDDQPITSYITDWAFCDAAHAFIFLSGLVCGMVYSRAIAQRGLRAGIAKAAKRSLQVYAAHLLTLALALLVTAGAYAWFNIDPDTFVMRPFYEHPFAAITHALTLTYTPWVLDILKMYILLLMALPWMVSLYQHSRVTAVGLSLVLYAYAQDNPDVVLPTYPENFQWFWNPLGWQLLYFGGVWIGIEKAAGRFRMVYHPALLIASIAVFGLMFWAWRRDVAGEPVLSWGWIDRVRLGPAHVVNFAAMAYIVAWTCRPTMRIWQSSWVRPIIRCGQLSLAVYSAGVLIDYLTSVVLFHTSHPGVEYCILLMAAGLTLTMPWCRDLALHWLQPTAQPAAASAPAPATLAMVEPHLAPSTIRADAIASVASLRLEPVESAPLGPATRKPDILRERPATVARKARRPVAVTRTPDPVP